MVLRVVVVLCHYMDQSLWVRDYGSVDLWIMDLWIVDLWIMGRSIMHPRILASHYDGPLTPLVSLHYAPYICPLHTSREGYIVVAYHQ